MTKIDGYAFKGCTKLISVHISDIESWCNISFLSAEANPLYYAHHLYIGNEEITDLVIPNSVTTIGEEAFSGFTALTSVTIGNSVKTIGWEAFSGCTGLTSVTIDNSVTNIGNRAFSGCTGLTSVTIGNSVKTIGMEAFSGCIGLTSVTIPNSVTGIGEQAFSGCTSLTSVYISDIKSWCNISFQEPNANPLYYAHHLYIGNEEIINLVIPNGVNRIGRSVFYGCSALKSITVPNSVTTIVSNAFGECSALTDLFCYAENVPGWESEYGMDWVNAYSLLSITPIKNITLHVPATSIDAYMNAHMNEEPWCYFKTIVALTENDPKP